MRLFDISTVDYKTQANAIKKLEKVLGCWTEGLGLNCCNWFIGANDSGRFFPVVAHSSLSNHRQEGCPPTLAFLVENGIRVIN